MTCVSSWYNARFDWLMLGLNLPLCPWIECRPQKKNSRTSALPYWPRYRWINTQGLGLRFYREDLTLVYLLKAYIREVALVAGHLERRRVPFSFPWMVEKINSRFILSVTVAAKIYMFYTNNKVLKRLRRVSSFSTSVMTSPELTFTICAVLQQIVHAFGSVADYLAMLQEFPFLVFCKLFCTPGNWRSSFTRSTLLSRQLQSLSLITFSLRLWEEMLIIAARTNGKLYLLASLLQFSQKSTFLWT